MKLSRRTMLELGAVGAAGLTYGGTKVADQFMLGPFPEGGRIDTHHHFMPKVFVETIGADRLASVTPTRTLPDWSVQRALDVCGSFGIAEGVLSISPGYPALAPAIERPLMRECNDAAATIRRDHPGKFGHFASIPMFNSGAALKEIEYALDTLNADGVVVFSNYDSKYLGDPSFAEVWQELDRRKAIVFVHPTSPGDDLAGQPPQSILEFPFDTTRAAVSLIFAGVTVRHPGIRFVLSHAGGALPFLAGRVNGAALLIPEIRENAPDVMVEIRKFWFDTALSGNPSALAALLVVADPARILFGSDFPYAPDIGIRVNVAGANRYLTDDRLRADIGRGNAARLLGRAV